VRVVVPQGPFVPQPTGPPTGLLPELPAGRLFGGLPRCEMAPGKLPEPLEEARGRPALDEPPAPALKDDHRREMVRLGRTRWSRRDRSGVGEGLPGDAPAPDRALRALGNPRPADRLPELHHRLVERPGSVEGHRLGEDAGQVASDPKAPDVPVLSHPAGCHAEAVGLQGRDRLVERQARDRRPDVRSHPRQGLPIDGARGESTAPGARDDLGRLPQVPGPGVVPRPLPALQDLVQGGGRERRHRGEPLEEPVVVRDRLFDPGLLEEDLGDPDPVRVPVPPPRQRATMGVEPPEQPAPPIRGGRSLVRRPGVVHEEAMPGKR
jgi:hypothetical protein